MNKYRITFLLLVFLLSFLNTLLFAQSEPENKAVVIDQVVAVVGNKAVLLSDIENQFLQYEAQGTYFSGNMKCQILEDMLYQKLLLNQAQIDSIEVTPAEVEMELDNRLSRLLSQIGTPEKLEEYFRNAYNKSMDEVKEEFKEVIFDQLMTRKMQQEIGKDVKVTPSDIMKFYKDLPKDSLPLIPTQYEFLQITKAPEITKEQKKQVKDELNKYRERILKGEKFSVLAVLYSEDPGSAKKGGDLGFVNRADLVPEFAAVAFSLKKDEVSRIVETEYGYHIIQMIERRGEQVNVRHILKTPKTSPLAKLKAKKYLDSLATVIRTDTLTFEQAAKIYSDDEESKINGGLVVNPYTGTSKFETKQLDPATNYIIKQKKLKVGQISDPFEGINSKNKPVIKIILLKDKTDAHIANLDEDYNFIQDIALQKKQGKVVDEWILKNQRETYIRIDKGYRNCDFRYDGWLKD